MSAHQPLQPDRAVAPERLQVVWAHPGLVMSSGRTQASNSSLVT
jgi:hypothetical protein